MPYANEHACRINDPGKYEKFRRQKGKDGQPDMIFGIKGGKSEVQSYRFPTDRFSATRAKKFCQEHDGSFEKAAKNATLCIWGNTEPAVPISAEIMGDTGPSRLFRKHLISNGHYVKESDGIEFTVTPGLMQHWVQTFARMKVNGVAVPIPDSHETVGKARHNLGHVEDMFIDGDKLIANLRLIGQDALDAAARNDVSISVPVEDVVDCKGNRYVNPIDHVAVTSTPLITGLDPFIPLAASRKWRLETKTMDWMELEKALSLEGLTDDNACEQIVKAFESRHKDTEALQASLKTTEDKLKGTELSLTEAKARARPEPEKLGSVTLNLARETQTARLDMLVEAAKITPAVRDGLHNLFIGKDGERIQASAANGTHGLFKDVVALFEANDPVKLAEQTGPQTTLRLSKSSDSDDSLVKMAKERAAVATG